jgi:hypothetical protein
MNFARFADQLGADTPRKRRALGYVLRAWDDSLLTLPRDRAEEVLTERARDDYTSGYGNPLMIFFLLTIIGAAISWAVQRLLDRWYPHGVCDEICDLDWGD